MLIEDYALGEAIYMTMITISTVGFSEVKPLSPAGRMFTSIFVMLNLAITAIFVSQLTQSLREGGLITKFYRSLMDREISTLSGHVIVCGAGRYGREIIEQLDDSEETVVLIELHDENLEKATSKHPELIYLQANATHDETLLKAGIERAKSLIVTLGDDSDNAFAVLSARQLAPHLTIIARVYEPESRDKLLRVGADHVVQPEHIGSFFMATLVRKPSAVEFFTSLANGPGAAVGFEEIAYKSLPEKMQGMSLLQMDLRKLTGVSVVAIRRGDGLYKVNPNPNERIEPGTSIIALGDQEQLDKLREIVQS